MASPLPPDPYVALGVPKDADASVIKSTYRKLVLKCHPDKVTDESLKKQKQEEFHKIQQAYELIGDEDKRATYDAEVKLNELRKEKLARTGNGGPSVEIRTAHYDIRTAAPGGATFGARGPARYEERKSSRSYDEDKYYEDRSSSRKYDTYEAYPKRSSPRTARTEKEPPVRVTRVSPDKSKSDHKKSKDKDERRDRQAKFVYVDDESSSDDKARYEAEYRRRTEEARRQREEDEARKQAAEARRKAEDRRSSEEPRRRRSDDPFDRQRKLSEQQNEAMSYINGSRKVEAERPSASRTTSSREAPRDYYDARDARDSRDSRDSRSRRDRPEPVRRSSARPRSPRPSSSGRDNHRDRNKAFPEIVEWEEEDRKPPSFKHSVSSPPEVPLPRATSQRSHIETSRDHRRIETSPPPMFRRSETMPTVHSAVVYPSSSSRRKEATPVRPSGLRSSETAAPHDSGYSSPGTPETSYPTVQPAQSNSTKKVYHYPTPGGGVRLSPEDVGVANGHRTVLREPDRHRTRSPSPLSRPPMGANRPSETSSSRYQPAAPAPSRTTSHAVPPPPLGRSKTMNVSHSPVRGEERGRSRPLYGEVSSDYSRRENARRQGSFSPDQVSYSRKILSDDIRWSGGRESDRNRPSIRRNETYVY